MCNVSDDLPPLGDAAFDPEVGSINADMGAKERLNEHEAGSSFSKVPPEVMAEVLAELSERVNDIPLEIEAVIGRAKVSVAELTRVDPGHRLRLDKQFGEPVELLVNGRLIGHGEIVADADDNLIGVRMVRIVR
jgi:flagellar motor switch protein FliN/FliY